MAFTRKGERRTHAAGRKRGTPNKLTRDLREAILRAFEEVGGQRYVARIAREHPAVFCALLARVLPRDVRLDCDSGPLVVIRDYAGRSRVEQIQGEAAEAVPALRAVQA